MAQEHKCILYDVGASFETLRERGYAYVDKTRFIKTLEDEETRYPFIAWPRRFEESVFANILMAYYDKVAKNDFAKNFFSDIDLKGLRGVLRSLPSPTDKGAPRIRPIESPPVCKTLQKVL